MKENKIIKVLKNPRKAICALAYSGALNWMDDKTYLQLLYFGTFGKKLNLVNPTTFNEKLQWLKLYDRNPQYTTMVDKYAAKQYVSGIIGEQYIIPTLGVWDTFDEINFSTLPNQFVLKCTHDSGGVVICKNKSTFNKSVARERINACLKRKFFYSGREWPYKNVLPRIIAEKYLESGSSNEELNDYKLMMFNGKHKCSFVCTNRYSEGGLCVTFYNTDWEIMHFERHYSRSPVPIACPKTYHTMVELAQKLSKDIPFVRIDFFEVDERPYFGEMTFFPGGGFEEFSPDSYDQTLGAWMEIPNSGKLNKDGLVFQFK